jgi:hypothetical protein
LKPIPIWSRNMKKVVLPSASCHCGTARGVTLAEAVQLEEVRK